MTYNEVGIHMLDCDIMGFDFLGKCTGERREESLGAGIGCQHRRRDGASKGPNIQDQTALPSEYRVR